MPLATLRRGTSRHDRVPFRDALHAWWKVSMQTFGGPAGQIAVMHREIVDERKWVDDATFLRSLSFCTMLPGPEALQLCIFLGWLLNGALGGIVAGTLFVLPGFAVMMGLSAVFVAWGTSTAVTAVFAGLGPAVVAIVAQAVGRLARKALVAAWMRGVAVAAFVALYFLGAPFPLVVATAALIGVVAARPRSDVARAVSAVRTRPSLRRSIRILLVGAVLWSAPVVVCAVVFGRSSVLAQESAFFAGTSMITFGGAYAVLSFVAQRAVVHYGWLTAGEMVQGLALAETTPGPLILVLQFVAFVGAYRAPGDLPPWPAAVLGATVAMWVTFLPSFTFVLAGAPYIEAMHDESRITAAMRGVSASVVGVIANLSVFFAVHTFFASTRVHRFGPLRVEAPQWSSVRPTALVVATVAAVLLFRVRLGTLRLLAACAVLGAAGHLLTS